MSRGSSERFFRSLVRMPKTVLAVAVGLFLCATSFLPGIVKDTSYESWFPVDHPARLSRDEVRRMFGIGNPLVVAIVHEGEHGIFEPEILSLVHRLSEEIRRIPGVDPERVRSLSTVRRIVGTEDGFETPRFFTTPPTTQRDAAAVREAALASDLVRGSLVAEDGHATLIVAGLTSDEHEQAASEALRERISALPTGAATVHVAGAAAVQGFLNEYIDTDARRLIPLAVAITLVLLSVAFRTVRSVAIPAVVILGTLVGALGLMAGVGVPWYSLTGAMAVVLIAGSVCDGVHILGRYYEEAARDPSADARTLVVRTMTSLWRAVTATSLTTMAGFLAMAASTFMQPVRAFGLFAAVGFALALVLSIFVLPVILSLLPPRRSSAYRPQAPGSMRTDAFGRAAHAVGMVSVRNPGRVLVATAVAMAVAVAGATRLKVDDAAIRYFQDDADIVIADRAINRHLDGTSILDLVVRARNAEDLYRPELLRRIDDLERTLLDEPRVRGSRSLLSYVKEMHRAMNEGRDDAYAIPDDPTLIAQYLFLYVAGGSPTELRPLVTSDFRQANLRFRLDTGRWSELTPVVERARRHVEEHFASPELTAEISGYVNVAVHRAQEVRRSQPIGIGLALTLVAACAAFEFGSLAAGLLCAFPIAVAVLAIYAVMGFSGIWLSTGTSIFAAVAIGLGIDFCLHVLEFLRAAVRDRGETLADAFDGLFVSTGRAILFNFLVVTVGFGILMTSEAPPIAAFGILVACALSTSFVGSLVLLPAIVATFRPRFIVGAVSGTNRRAAIGAGAILTLLTLGATPIGAEPPPLSGPEIVRRADAASQANRQTLTLWMELTDASGTVRTQQAQVFRADDDRGDRRTAIFFEAPTHLRGTGFLTIDHATTTLEDDRWLYLPALRKVRRISAADRGGYFMGTDFTYDDMKTGSGITPEDYRWTAQGQESFDGHPCWVVEGIPVSPAVAAELGYGRTLSWVDAETWKRRKIEIWDVAGNHLKTVEFRELREVDGIWTPHVYVAKNHKSGHSTRIEVREVDYAAVIDPAVFTERALRRGPR